MKSIAAALLLATHLLYASELPDGFTEEVVLSDLHAATTLVPLADGRVLIADQTGKLLVLKEDRLLPKPMLDLTERIDSWWERGLVGATVHPDFPHSPWVYVLYVAAKPYPHHVLSRWTVIGDEARDEQVLLVGDDQTRRGGKHPGGHQGGPLCFGQDGKTYIALGEPIAPGEATHHSQRLDALEGKILRLNADGSIPEDNPFFAKTSGKYRAVWAIGMRNPFGLAMQRETGKLFATDVGQTSFEEVNHIERGKNYGWPKAEGITDKPGFTNPLHAYPPVVGRSVVGGAFVPRTSNWPAEWRGKFLFADWAAHWIKALDPEATSEPVTFVKALNNPVAMAFDSDGSLLVLNRGTIWRDAKKFKDRSGTLLRLRYAPGETSTVKAEPFPEVFAQPAEEFTPLTLNAEPWTPGLRVERSMHVPPGQHIRYDAEAEWIPPVGSIAISHYSVLATGQRFETQVLWFTGPHLARAAAYRWPEGKLIRDATVCTLPGDEKHRWFSPGTERQLRLDLSVLGYSFPLNARQLHCGDQLKRLPWLTKSEPLPQPLASLDDLNASAEQRVRSYLDANCAMCHRPGGPSRGHFDVRFTTALAEQKLILGEHMAGDLGHAGARIVVPGDPQRSVLLQRLARKDAFRMPQTSVNDDPSPLLPVLETWIRSLP